MRKAIFWFGWAVLCILPIALVVEIYTQQDIPVIQPWKWAILVGSVLIIILSRNRDDVLKHRLVKHRLA